MDFGSIYTRFLQLGTGAFRTTIQANPTADRTASLPDKSGTIALLDDFPAVSPTLLFASHDSATITGVTTEQVFAGSTYTIPANTLRVGDVIFISALWAFTGSTNAKQLRLFLNSTLLSSTGITSATTQSLEVNRWVRVRSSTELVSLSAGIWQGGSSGNALPAIISADIALPISFQATGLVATASEFIRLDSIYLQVFRAGGNPLSLSATAPLSYSNTTGVFSIAPATPSLPGSMSAADKTKLDGVQSGATANSSDAELRDRSTHTNTQPIASVQGLQTALDSKLGAPLQDADIPTSIARDAEVQSAIDTHAAATGNAAHLPSSGITNDQVATNAAIGWAKISKTGATPADVGIDPASFATAAQGALANSALQPAAIGSSVQQYSARLAELVSGFAGASVLAVPRKRADGNAIEWATPAASGGSDQSVIRQTAKPTVRSDGSALQVGDFWIQSGVVTGNFEWAWNGQYWLSRISRIASWGSTGAAAITSNVTEVTIFEPEPGFGLWLHNAKITYRSQAVAHDTANNFTVTVLRRNVQLTSTNVFTAVTNPSTANTFSSQEIANEFLLDTDALQVQALRFLLTRLGSATLSAFKLILPVRLVHLS